MTTWNITLPLKRLLIRLLERLLAERFRRVDHQLAARRSQGETLEQLLRDLHRQTVGVEKWLAGATTRIDTLEQSLSDLHTQIIGVEKWLSGATTRIETQEQSLGDLQAQVVGAEKWLSGAGLRIEALKTQLAAHSAHNETVISRIEQGQADLHMQIVGVEKWLSGATTRIEALETGGKPAKPASEHFAECDVGRLYQDPAGVLPHFTLTPAEPRPWTAEPTRFRITTTKGTIERVVYHPHLCFLKLCKEYDFRTALDVGCGDGNEAELLRFLGKEVTTINFDPAPEEANVYHADYFADYLDLNFQEPFDCIWCSHVLEHQRNPGLFLDKLHDDLKEGGVLALSVPYNEFSSPPAAFTLGHHNRYNITLLLYALVCARFDCREASVRVYNRQISVLVRKRSNHLNRSNFANYDECKQFFPFALEQHGNFDAPNLNWEAVSSKAA
jgi:SAM-dependent methyltransferase